MHGCRRALLRGGCAHEHGHGVGDRARPRPGLLRGACAAVGRRRRTDADDHDRPRRARGSPAAARGDGAVVVGLGATRDVGHRGGRAGRGSTSVRRDVQRRGPLRLPHEHGGRVRAGLERADRAAPHRTRPRRAAVGDPLRRRGRRVPVPQGAARPSRAGTAFPARPVDRAADAGARHDLLPARAAGPRRGRREGATRGGPPAAPRLRTRRARVARRGDLERRAREAPRAGVARARISSGTAPTTWRRTRASWRSSDATVAPTT